MVFRTSSLPLFVAGLLLRWSFVEPFSSLPRHQQRRNSNHLPRQTGSLSTTRLHSGKGIAKGYTWTEEAFEIDVTVKVPKDTRAKDVQFKAKPRSIDLRLLSSTARKEEEEPRILLNGDRPLRGRVSLDGTYWVISDVTEDHDMPLAEPYREVTVTIEKLIATPKDDFDVVEYDWKGVYAEEYENEVSYRRYDGPEELNVHEYAAGLGVDLDNLNMSLVDKTMFSSGLNLTQSSLDELSKAGLVSEVTQQADGSEFVVNETTGEAQAVNPLGLGSEQAQDDKKRIPFLDTNSPWHNAIPVNETEQFKKSLGMDHEAETTTTSAPAAVTTDAVRSGSSASDSEEDVMQQKRYFTRAAFAKDAAAAAAKKKEDAATKRTAKADAAAAASDPIDLLTVKKLKEILKSQGLKVSGNKKELQERVRSQVNALLQGGDHRQEEDDDDEQ